MTGKTDTVGFLATGSGVKKFQLSLWACFIFHCCRFSAQLASFLCFDETTSGLGHVAIIRRVDQPNPAVRAIQQNIENGKSQRLWRG
jgi:hypothetical protein